MEILIIGGALVALMVYVSTRVKNSAASAYKREKVETEEFSIIKPEEFISPFDENSEYAFTALSRDFGTDEAEEFRQARADLRVYQNTDFEEMRRNAAASTGKILSDETSESAAEKICLLLGEKTENEIQSEIFYKIVESKTQNKIYELKITVLSEFKKNYSAAVNELLSGFEVK